MEKAGKERRRYEHLTLARPVPARYGSEKVFVLDLSINGARIAHQHRTLEPTSARIRFEWQGFELAFDAEVLRTSTEPTKVGNSLVYESGLFFFDKVGDSENNIRELIADQIMRVLDERKANARGIPPIAATYVRTGSKTGGYVTWRLVGSSWKSSPSPSPEQPIDGFTVSANESNDQVEMLCSTYQNSDTEGRRMIRKMAELSVSSPDGVATRKFEP